MALKLELPQPDMFPVVSFSGKESAINKTLKDLGILKGSVLLRVHFRPKNLDDDALLAQLESQSKERLHRATISETVSEPNAKVQRTTPPAGPSTSSCSSSVISSVSSSTTNVARLPNGAKASFANFSFSQAPDRFRITFIHYSHDTISQWSFLKEMRVMPLTKVI